jgi:DNA-binding beta-propeller fold protein YncE
VTVRPCKDPAPRRRPGSGVFQIKAVAAGTLGAITVVPPDPGTDGSVQLAIGGGGDTYNVPFAGGRVTNAGAKLFKIVKPPPPCTFLLKWGIPSGAGNGQFDFPHGVATDGSGNVYVTDTGNSRIQKFDASGTFLTTWGSLGSGNGQFDLRPMLHSVQLSGHRMCF